MHGVISKGNNGATEILQCPFAPHHHHGQNQSTPEDPVATNMSLPLLGPAPAPDAGPDPNPPLASILDDTCPLESNSQSIHDEIIPPEHEELKKGYAGKTCPFLEESTGLGDQEEEEEEAGETNDQEMRKGHVSLFHSTISPSYRHEQVLGQEEEENVGENNREAESMNRCPYHKSSSGNSSQCGPHDVMQNLQPSIMSNNSSTLLETNHLPISNLLSCPPPAPQTAVQARRQMDDILSAQKKAQEEIYLCQQRLQKAQQDLDRAMMQQSSLDQMARDSAESWTDMLLQDDKKNIKWNNMYRKLEAYKAKHGHCDVKRQLTKKEKEMDPDLAALSHWVGKNRNEGRKAAEEGGDRSDRMEPYKIAALNRLGFDWAPRDNAWMQNYERVKAYLEKNPGKLPQRRKSELGVWANGQIIEYNKFMAGNSKAYITQQKIDLLNKINFPWDRMQNTWLERYQSLKEFHSKYGHCRVTKTYEDQVLYRWVTKERMKYRNYLAGEKPRQTTEQWTLLEKLDFMEGNKISVVPKKRKLDVEGSSELEQIICTNKRLVSDCDSTSV